MKKYLMIALAALLLAAFSTSDGLAQGAKTDTMKMDTMKKDAMKMDTMKKDGMKMDAMKKVLKKKKPKVTAK